MTEKPTLVLRGRVVGENPGHEVGESPLENEEDVGCKPAVFGACLFKLPFSLGVSFHIHEIGENIQIEKY